MVFTTQSQSSTSLSTPPRRPSQARIRKSISKNSSTKRVTWCPTEEESVHRVDDHYDGIDHGTIWFSREELRATRLSNEFLVSDYGGLARDDSTRGLEAWTDQGSWERYEHHRDCLHKVLDEQDRQKGIDQTECRFSPSPLVKRVNHLHLEFDHDRLGALCRDATAKARRAALLRGRRDYLETQTKEEEPKVQPRQESEKPTPPTPQVNDEDTTTVLTEASTAVGSHAEQEEMPSRSPPVLREIRVPATAESLLVGKNARFANYLASRQQRLDAPERADYKWEQCKLARTAASQQEAEAHLERMQRRLRQRNELVALVAAR